MEFYVSLSLMAMGYRPTFVETCDNVKNEHLTGRNTCEVFLFGTKLVFSDLFMDLKS